MKKIFYLIVGVLMFIPLFAKADMVGPAIMEYKASITNPDGAYLYKMECNDSECNHVMSSEKLPYGKEVTIEYEDEGFAFPKEYNGYLKIKDITAVEKNYNVSLKDLDASQDAIVLVDRTIKTGPAEGYPDTEVIIAAGTNIKIRFFKEDGGKDGGNPWAYVEYNETKGFINIMNASVAYGKVEESNSMMINKNAKIKDPSTSEVVGTIKTNTIINSNGLRFVDPWSRSYYLTYNGVSGIVSYYDFVEKSDELIEYTLFQKYDIHETSELDSKVIGSLDSGTVFSTYYDYWDKGDRAIYYDSANVKGWIIPLYDMETDTYIGIKSNGETIETHSSETVVSTNNENDIEKPVPKTDEKLYTYIGAAFALLITAIVTIVLINQKKKLEK